MSRESETPKVLFLACNPIQVSGQCDCNCDCACSLYTNLRSIDNVQSLSRIPSGRFRRSSFYIENIDNRHLICYGAGNQPAVLNQPAFELLSHFDQPASVERMPAAWCRNWNSMVIQSSLRQMIDLGLLISEGCTARVPFKTSTTLTTWLHITDRCNLRCTYCYLSHNPVDMSYATGRASIDATLRSAFSHGYSHIKLKYAGGEPLLRFALITELHSYAQDLAARQGQSLDSVVLSNGTLLTREMAQVMQSLDLRLMISLDGIAKFHDCQRHFADGRGSFDAAARAIDLALSYGLIPDISITVSGRNVDGLPELLAWVLERDLPFSLNFYRENARSVSHVDLQLEEERIVAGMLRAYKVIEANLPRHNLLASLADRANLAVPHCRTCSVGQDYLVFDPQGRVAKCQMDIEHTVTDVKDLDPLGIVRESTIGIRNPEVDEKPECRDCQWRYWCTGGCPLMAYRATGRYDAKSPNCTIYRTLLPEVVRLEGLRLLKYTEPTLGVL